MGGVYSVAFSRDGKHIVSGSGDNTIRLWDAGTGEPLWPLLGAQGHSFQSVAFSPDGQRVVSGSWEGAIQLWDVATGETQRAPLEGYLDSVGSVAVRSDGTDIVSRSQDRTIYPFDALAIREHDLQRFIRFSIHPGQHLVDTTALIDDITDPAQNESALPVRIREDDRWTVIGPKERLLFWVPPTYNHRWDDPRLRWIIPVPDATPLDLSHMAHGLSWESCYRRHADV
ncbi:WD40-repeat-containing domain protein [Suillus paluster]|uniref:WD40-repeat-containing domain protein n=1 Tax=Suillus paluster TaxID=48578 RepID=UPI001B85D02D|nr:WD40-repeat-containing domain protein [Suillus paluster]KAG1728404.1 WD40-repeat-containing domain protein [Suillus paluster]